MDFLLKVCVLSSLVLLSSVWQVLCQFDGCDCHKYHSTCNCGNYGSCQFKHMIYRCHCNSGYHGYRCEHPPSSLTATDQCDCHYHPSTCNCGDHGTCHYDMTARGYRCRCNNEYTGATCRRAPTSHQVQPADCNCGTHTISCSCGSNGACRWSDIDGFRCICNAGYTGSRCLTETGSSSTSGSGDKSPECNNHGHFSNGECTCFPERTGDSCQYALRECGVNTGVFCANGICTETNHVGDYYSHYWSCSCHNHWTGSRCDISTKTTTTTPETSSLTTTTPVTTTSTTAATTTPTTPVITTPPTTPLPTTQATVFYSCDITSTINDISKHVNSSDPKAVTCQGSGTHESHEAFVFGHCPTVPTDASTWTPGKNVGTDCNDIPQYTAVAAFYHGTYNSMDSISGVLLKCTQDGFQLGVQQCGRGPSLIDINHDGINLLNSNVYYTISV